MDFLKEFSKQFTNVARSVSEKSKESGEATRLNAEVKSAREALEQLYGRYGRACYALQAGRGGREEVERLAVRIHGAELALEELTARQDAARELKRCPSCGMVHPKEARFCSACGKKLPEEAPKPEPVEAGEYCPACGAKREGGEAACPVCGAPFAAESVAGTAPEPAPAPAAPGPDVEEPDDLTEE